MKFLIIVTKLFVILAAMITAAVFAMILFLINNIYRNCLNKLSIFWKKITNGTVN